MAALVATRHDPSCAPSMRACAPPANREVAPVSVLRQQCAAAEARMRGHDPAFGHADRTVLEFRNLPERDRGPDWSACSPPLRNSRTGRTPRPAACHRRRARRARSLPRRDSIVSVSPGVTPICSRSSGCTEATGSGSMLSSTEARRVIEPVCQCSSWRPVISTSGYCASGRSAAEMRSAGTNLARPVGGRKVVRRTPPAVPDRPLSRTDR